MYEDLDYNIKNYEYDDPISDEDWSDFACDFTGEVLDEFTEEDWNKLFQELPNKSTMWKKRFSDLLTDPEDSRNLRGLMEMANTDDIKLFVNVIMNLNSFDLSEVEGLEPLFEKAEQLVNGDNNYGRSILVSFLEKKNRGKSR